MPKLMNKAPGDLLSKLQVIPLVVVTFFSKVCSQLTHPVMAFGHLKEQGNSKAYRSEGTRKHFNGVNKPGLLTGSQTLSL